jgi:Fic family protein
MNTPLSDIDTLLQELQSLRPLKPEWQKKLDEKFRLEFNFNSNHMEGNTLTYGETKLLLLFDQTTGEHTLREYEEVKAHDVALRIVTEAAAEPERPLTETFIKELNRIILVRPFWKDAITPDGQATRREIQVGEYKQHPNHVRLENGEIFEYASVTDTPIKMGELVAWYNEQEQEQQHPVFIAAMLHYKFVCIHPFDDGNGRVARLLMNYVLLKHGLPPVVIKSAEKKQYLAALNRADAGDLEAFVDYIARQLEWSLQLALKAARGESVEEAGDLDKRIALLKKNLASKDHIAIPKTWDSLYETVIDGFVPLLEELEDKVTELSDLFHEIKPTFWVQHSGGGSPFGDSSKWRTNIQTLMTAQKANDNYKNLNFLELSFSLNGLKSALERNTFNIGTKIVFEEYAFVLTGYGRGNKKYPYRSADILRDREKWINEWLGNLIEDIQNAVKTES